MIEISSAERMAQAVKELGFLPLFANGIKGFSVEENTPPKFWFNDVEGPWEWKGPTIRLTNCAYGKFFNGKTSFITRDWYFDFANYRRDGYDYDSRCDEGLAPYQDRNVYETLAAHGSLLSKDLKYFSGYGGKKRHNFEAIVARLQAQGYIVVEDFEYEIDKYGKPCGWGLARYTTPERLFGKEFTDKVYSRSPEESKERILKHISSLFPQADEKQILRLIR